MDVHCSSCGEPWDTYHLSHDAIHETDLPPDEVTKWNGLTGNDRLSKEYRSAFEAAGYKFGRTMMNVIHCPCCPPGATPDPDMSYFKAELETLLDGDEDALAAELEDLRL